jgi:hypothetical protein
MTQSHRLHAIQKEAQEIRLAYARGDITHEERMAQLNALVRGPRLRDRITSFLFRKRKPQ